MSEHDMKPANVSRGGVPERMTAADLLALDDGMLGAMVVAALSASEPRHSNFAALGRLVRLGVSGRGADGYSCLDEVLRRPGSDRDAQETLF